MLFKSAVKRLIYECNLHFNKLEIKNDKKQISKSVKKSVKAWAFNWKDDFMTTRDCGHTFLLLFCIFEYPQKLS